MKLSHGRIVLRELTLSDTLSVHAYASQSVVSKYQAWGPNTIEDTTQFLLQVIEDRHETPRKRFCFGLEYEGQLIGSGELHITESDNAIAEIGYIIAPDQWGKGFATKLTTMLLAFGFEQLNLHRIFATCDPQNIGSFKVMEKVGMQREGLIRGHLRINGGWRDSLLYSMLTDEYRRIEYIIDGEDQDDIT